MLCSAVFERQIVSDSAIWCVQHDCFQRAVDMLRNMSVEEIQALEDCGKEALKAEVQRQSEEDLEAFKTFLHVSDLLYCACCPTV